MPEFRPLAKNHIRDLYRLEVRPDQTKFVAPNGVTMAQWPFEPGSMVFGIWEGETAVGLLAMIDFSHPEADLQEGEDPTAEMKIALRPISMRLALAKSRAAVP